MMFHHIIKFLLVNVIFTVCVGLNTSSSDWDIIVFTQHWPVTVCIQWKEKQKQHTCLLPGKNIWTVHGIWPTKIGSMGPQFCNHTAHFDPVKLQPIMTELTEYWPDVYNDTDHYSLWKHEWLKHGTCAQNIQTLDSEVKYFEQGVSWMNWYNMDNALARAGIMPGTEGYLLQTIWNSVTNAIGKRPTIQCIKDSESDMWYLFEIRICFNKTLNLVDCDNKTDTNIKTNCPFKKPIMYLSHPVHDTEIPINDEKKHFRAPWLRHCLDIILWIQWMTL